MIPEQREQLFEQFRAMDTNTHAFDIERTPERAREQPDRTFSEEAFASFVEMTELFIGGRVMAHWDKTGKAPHKAKVIITVVVE